jgi:short-subunit dehydrogenase
VVTGAGSGIGRATASLLAQRGCRLALADVDAAGLEGTRTQLPGTAGDVSVHVVDVADIDRVVAFAGEVQAQHGGCHILVNNAGVAAAGRFEEESLEDLRWIVGIDIWGVLHGCRAFLPLLRRADEAHIVNLASMTAFVGLPHNASYSMTKGAVRAFTEGLRSELIGTPIGVTAVFPGAIHTNIARTARGAESQRLRAMADNTLASRFLTSPEAVARRIVHGIEQNRPRVVVGPDARLLDITARLLPGRSGLVGRIVDRLTR